MGGAILTPNTPLVPNIPHTVSMCLHTRRYRPTLKWSSRRSHRSVPKSLILGKRRKSSNSIPSLKVLLPSWTPPPISPVNHHTCCSQCCPTPPATNWNLINSTTRWTPIGNTNSITKWTPTNSISNTQKWTPTLSTNNTRRWTPISIHSTTKLILIHNISSTIKWTLTPNNSSTLLTNSKL